MCNLGKMPNFREDGINDWTIWKNIKTCGFTCKRRHIIFNSPFSEANQIIPLYIQEMCRLTDRFRLRNQTIPK